MFDTKEQVRCGYLVTEKTKKIWAVEMDLLQKLLAVCQKYELTCWAIAGTMLGAVRHKGFIPWDDDIDVALPRNDFQKLISVAEKEFTFPYFLQTPRSDPYYFSPTIRLRNSNTTGIIESDKRRKTNNGIYIDIFPLDSWPSDIKQQQRLIRKVHLYNKLLIDRQYLQPSSWINKFWYCINKVYFALYKYESVLDKYDSICSQYNQKETNMIAYVARGVVKNDGYRYAWSKEETCSTVYLDFEDMQVPVPVGYESCLRKRYGDYMEFPPVEKRGQWHSGVITFDPDTPYEEYQKNHSYL